jgi:hypothetical protein
MVMAQTQSPPTVPTTQPAAKNPQTNAPAAAPQATPSMTPNDKKASTVAVIDNLVAYRQIVGRNRSVESVIAGPGGKIIIGVKVE